MAFRIMKYFLLLFLFKKKTVETRQDVMFCNDPPARET